ncbi:MAG: cysteine desulfurase [Oscillospiraceae bacterium]|nr:cysteine desulfurase [Oscillospiraceae bacterium]
MNDKTIYLDHAATAPMCPGAIQAMTEAFTDLYGNASSGHAMGEKSKKALNQAREYLLKTLSPLEDGTVYFTSGGTESDNWAIKGILDSYPGKHIITSKIEHNAILNTCAFLEKHGYSVTYLDVDTEGFIRLPELEAAIRPDTILITIMFANNEIGTIQPVQQIGAIAHRHGILFHTDAVQAYGQVPIDVDEMNIDMLSISSHKFRGPKGVGFLYVKNGVRLDPLIHGGSQEDGMRAGTVNVPGIVGMRAAAEESFDRIEEKMHQLAAKRDHLICEILDAIPCAGLNGPRERRLPGNVNICFRGQNAGLLLDRLSDAGIHVSSGSACSSASSAPSHVLTAIGLSEEDAAASLRLTLSQETSYEELDRVVSMLKAFIL